MDKPQNQPAKQPGHPNLNVGRWKKGESGNPAGRPKGKSLLAEIREVLDGDTLCGKKNPGGVTTRRFLAEMALLHAIKGRSAYFREIMERLFGKVPLRVEQRNIDADEVIDLPSHVIDAGLKAMLEAAGESTGPES